MVVFGEPLQKLKAHEIFKDNIDLFQAVKNNDLDAILAAVIRDQPFNVKDKNGNNLLHAAVKNANRSTVRAILKFSSQFELWSLKNNEGKFPQDLSNEANIKKDINAISTIRPSQKTHNCMFNKLLVEKRIKEPKENYKTLLSLDGGGIRVLLQCSVIFESKFRDITILTDDNVFWCGQKIEKAYRENKMFSSDPQKQSTYVDKNYGFGANSSRNDNFRFSNMGFNESKNINNNNCNRSFFDRNRRNVRDFVSDRISRENRGFKKRTNGASYVKIPTTPPKINPYFVFGIDEMYVESTDKNAVTQKDKDAENATVYVREEISFQDECGNNHGSVTFSKYISPPTSTQIVIVDD